MSIPSREVPLIIPRPYNKPEDIKVKPWILSLKNQLFCLDFLN